ncbi:transmembrane protein, putative (macronuclear) [Tetrahymena thermophila SB210]|uniref:Transmembrane protein, putative n=1 Tax=Tetrahymena thermophila (strain SB210) TaxID=312017 RepID=Q24CV4_TETTS|nr:transmembrane protein, putative [Tetrahymena thermophila SB210]EAS05654.1 transmembrane protein, putative [Tetrahymena thermophila SB210]|eukprot:XP_001025899.1 transmembrane protein, putative [Tetrahymena thermophila SB210]
MDTFLKINLQIRGEKNIILYFTCYLILLVLDFSDFLDFQVVKEDQVILEKQCVTNAINSVLDIEINFNIYYEI